MSDSVPVHYVAMKYLGMMMGGTALLVEQAGAPNALLLHLFMLVGGGMAAFVLLWQGYGAGGLRAALTTGVSTLSIFSFFAFGGLFFFYSPSTIWLGGLEVEVNTLLWILLVIFVGCLIYLSNSEEDHTTETP